MVYEEDKVVIRDAMGKEKTFYKLIQFYSQDTNKRYLIYTDNKKDVDGKLNLYSSILKEEYGTIQFLPVEEQNDLDVVHQAIIQSKIEFMEKV